MHSGQDWGFFNKYIATGDGAVNPPIYCQYEVSGIPGQDGEDENPGETKSGAEFTYVPINKTLNIETMTASLNFEGVVFVDNGKLNDFRVVDQNRYAVEGVSFSLVETDNPKSVSVKISGELENDANYTLVIPENFCGNSTWNTADYKEGAANPQILIPFIANNDSTGVALIKSESENYHLYNGIYNMQGIIISKYTDDAIIKLLPKGLYIINGSKKIIK